MRALFINDYAMDTFWTWWKAGEVPAHHLWGVTQLADHGIDVDILPFRRFPVLDRVGRRLRLGGHLDLQLRALAHCRQYDVIYSGSQFPTNLLSGLRARRLLRTPLVSLVHQPPPVATPPTFFTGHDRLVCISRAVLARLREARVAEPSALTAVDWGPDLAFYEPARGPGVPGRVVSAGKSKRDHDLLVSVFRGLPQELDIFCSADSAPLVEAPPNVRVHAAGRPEDLVSYRQLLAHYATAQVVAVPLAPTDTLAGLTSLLDAMALAKPVVITRNANLDIDVEAEGLGLWVEPGDAAGWRHALTALAADPARAARMGERGHELCREQFNLDAFTAQLADVLHTATSP